MTKLTERTGFSLIEMIALYLFILSGILTATVENPQTAGSEKEVDVKPILEKTPMKKDLVNALAGGNEGEAVRIVNQGLPKSAAFEAAQAAIGMEMPKLLELLLSRGVKAADSFGESLLMKAAFDGKLSMVVLLHEKGGLPVNQKSKSGATALIRAALGGHPRIVEYLIEKGADVNSNETIGSDYSILISWESFYGTPLMAAIVSGSEEAADILLKKNADTKIRNSRNYDSFEMAIRFHRISIMKKIADVRGFSVSDQMMHAARLNLDVLRHIVENDKADVNLRDLTGMTALMHTAKSGDFTFVHEKVHRGNVNGPLETAEYLLGKGARIDEKGPEGATALMFAALKGNSGLIDLLLSHGADPDLRDSRGKCAAEYVVFPEAPPDTWENAYESWCWENKGIHDMQDMILKKMKNPPGKN